ncbi:MAG: DNA polymerase III subunit alpha [Patescibacteria group bacterium]
MSRAPFIHLHTHTHYSLLDGLSQTEQLVKLAKKHEMPALAITDHGNMYGAIEFYKLCKDAGLKPIIGVEAYIANRTRFDKDPNIDNKRFHLTLLAKNEIGYKNLIKLVSASHLEGYYYKPRMDHDLLRNHSEGLVALSGCFGGELARALQDNNEMRAREVIELYQDIFGEDNYFLEVWHDPSLERGLEIKNKIIKLGKDLKIPIVGTQDSHYLSVDDKHAHETMLAIQTSADMSDQSRFSMAKGDYSFISNHEAYEKFKDNPEAIENTNVIANMCNLKLTLGKWVFPPLQIASGTTPDEELARLAREGLIKKELVENNEINARIDYELKIIRDKGYAPYFLVVADLLNFAHEKGIFTNTRGSAAGSLVSYLTGITTVNPIEYNLPFERFLNPERPSAPDVDMDLADNRRDEVIEYARNKYGADHVAQIGTFGTMLARGVVRDVARALGHPYILGDKISKLIPLGSQGFPMTIDNAFKLEPELKKLYESDQTAREILDVGKRIEGCVRHISVHAAGVVIAPTNLTDFTPLQNDPKGGKVITQYDMYSIEDAGLLKFDFLGIRNLAILADAVERVEKIRNEKINIEKIPLNDKKTFEMLARGETMGLFQLNGAGMTRALVELRPTRIDDINVMVALYRPGPMDNINEYIKRKRGEHPVTYLHPKMKSFLDRTFGVLVYQDDLLMTAIEVAGYSWGEVDKFRKAVGKKIPAEMAKQHIIFVEGCQKHGGMNEQKAEELWELFEPFQGYGFNKAHAASYGWVAYQTAYMKANFPAEYMTAVLTAESGDVEEVGKIIEECKRMGFEVLTPDVNESYSDFTAVKDSEKIRFGLRGIKNFGEEIGKAIIRERKGNGPYKSYSDFLTRVQHKNLNKKSLESLIMAGALDSLGERGQLLANIEEALAFSRALSNSERNQTSLFGAETTKPIFRMKSAEPATMGDKLRWEKELLGFYISGHPLEAHKDKFAKHDETLSKIKTYGNNTTTLAAGLLSNTKIIITKSGNKMLFGRLEDFTDSIEVVAFSDTYNDFKDILINDACIAIRGSVSHRNGTPSIVIEKVKKLE